MKIISKSYDYHMILICDKNGNEIPKRELTEEEFKERTMLIERMRDILIRRKNTDYPLIPADCF